MEREDFEEMDPETQQILEKISPAPPKMQEEGWSSQVQQQQLLEKACRDS